MTSDHQLVLCTCPSESVALAIAEDLVKARLAACVSLLPGVTSVYRWLDQVERAAEIQLQIKTHQSRLEALTERIRELHPYEVPEIIALPITAGLPSYLSWIDTCVR